MGRYSGLRIKSRKNGTIRPINMTEKLPRYVLNLPLVYGCIVLVLLVGCNRDNATQKVDQTPMKSGPIVYVALGDSTGSGVGAREGGYVARLFKRLVERRPESRLSNLCVSGATSVDVLRDQLDQGVAMDPDLVTLGIGINDIGHGLTLDQFSRNYEEILSTLKEKTRAEIVVTNIPDVSTAPRIPGPMRSEYQQQIMQFSRRLEEIAARHGVTVFDIFTITTQKLASHPEYFSADGFHPSDQGYEFWAQEMWPTLARVLGDSE